MEEGDKNKEDKNVEKTTIHKNNGTKIKYKAKKGKKQKKKKKAKKGKKQNKKG